MEEQVKIDGDGIIHIQNDADAPKCPFCGSTDTEMLDKPPNVSYYCNACEKNWEPNKDAEDMQDEEKSDGEMEDSEMEDEELEDEKPPKEKMDSTQTDVGDATDTSQLNKVMGLINQARTIVENKLKQLVVKEYNEMKQNWDSIEEPNAQDIADYMLQGIYNALDF